MGAMATSAQAGARLPVPAPLGGRPATLLVTFLVEMSGRFAAVTRKAIPDAIRDHFGFSFWLVPFLVLTLSQFLVLATEIGGICFALHLVTGLPTQFWALPVAVLTWLFLWRSTFNTIENSTSLLGLITLAFVVAAVRLDHPPGGHEVLSGLPAVAAPPGFCLEDPAPSPSASWARCSPPTCSTSPSSSAAVEDGWDRVLCRREPRGSPSWAWASEAPSPWERVVVAAMVLAPRGIQVDDYHQAAMMLTVCLPLLGLLCCSPLAWGSPA